MRVRQTFNMELAKRDNTTPFTRHMQGITQAALHKNCQQICVTPLMRSFSRIVSFTLGALNYKKLNSDTGQMLTLTASRCWGRPKKGQPLHFIFGTSRSTGMSSWPCYIFVKSQGIQLLHQRPACLEAAYKQGPLIHFVFVVLHQRLKSSFNASTFPEPDRGTMQYLIFIWQIKSGSEEKDKRRWGRTQWCSQYATQLSAHVFVAQTNKEWVVIFI